MTIINTVLNKDNSPHSEDKGRYLETNDRCNVGANPTGDTIHSLNKNNSKQDKEGEGCEFCGLKENCTNYYLGKEEAMKEFIEKFDKFKDILRTWTVELDRFIEQLSKKTEEENDCECCKGTCDCEFGCTHIHNSTNSALNSQDTRMTPESKLPSSTDKKLQSHRGNVQQQEERPDIHSQTEEEKK